MRTIIAIACLGLLMWVEPAGAQKTYTLSVSHHRTIELSDDEVKRILAAASNMLKDAECDVTFKLQGPVKPFASVHTPKIIKTKAHRDAVHRENSDIKVVEAIHYCRGSLGKDFNGCAWPPQAGGRPVSIIVVRPENTRGFSHILWAHEFGHRTGLRHRNDPLALMTCGPGKDQAKVSRDECGCLLRGPERRCRRSDPDPSCKSRCDHRPNRPDPDPSCPLP